jgi:hypothetical protein
LNGKWIEVAVAVICCWQSLIANARIRGKVCFADVSFQRYHWTLDGRHWERKLPKPMSPFAEGAAPFSISQTFENGHPL